MVRVQFHGDSNTYGAGESGVAAALPPSLCFGAAGCHLRAKTLWAGWRDRRRRR